jgi:hypothetical protein
MSTPQRTHRHPKQRRLGVAASVLALGALIAITVSIVFVALPGSHRKATTTAAAAATGAHSDAAHGYLRGRTTHALLHVGTTACDAAALRGLGVEKPCYSAP